MDRCALPLHPLVYSIGYTLLFILRVTRGLVDKQLITSTIRSIRAMDRVGYGVTIMRRKPETEDGGHPCTTTKTGQGSPQPDIQYYTTCDILSVSLSPF